MHIRGNIKYVRLHGQEGRQRKMWGKRKWGFIKQKGQEGKRKRTIRGQKQGRENQVRPEDTGQTGEHMQATTSIKMAN